MHAAVTAVRDTLETADTAVVFTGAGVSTASGIPDFRGDDGRWSRFDPGAFEIQRFHRDPAGFWSDYLELHADLRGDRPEPNAAHHAIASLETTGSVDAVITQNVDGLHQTAGTDTVIELHGNADRVICRDCGVTTAAREINTDALPPRCSRCDGAVKPDTVLFGEPLPERAFTHARTLTANTDVFIAAGSSLVVKPAASLPRLATDTDSKLIIVNQTETPLDETADIVIHRNVTEILPAITNEMR